MNYEKRNGKYVFELDGIYFPLTYDQLCEMLEAITRIMHQEDGEEDR